jgi:hypothetical protein
MLLEHEGWLVVIVESVEVETIIAFEGPTLASSEHL